MRYPQHNRFFYEALEDPVVIRALAKGIRNAAIRYEFNRLRDEGIKAYEAIDRLAEAFFLSDEAVRTIVYRKGQQER